jgi:hypothetical protein
MLEKRNQTMEMKNYMRVQTREDNDVIPEGKAILSMDNNGFVGTNNGWPMVGQPALYPQEQAREIAHIWNEAQSNGQHQSHKEKTKANIT